ncbi:MAG: septal ring lytic transglycosylase RlpA family protein [Gammaproteobacteria bacterium]|nr:septal ring lytic transglycosylase RlpA family protein [Gammaproteobacteria bacterium]
MHNYRFYRRITWGLLFVSVIILNGCATKHKKDGPPDYYVDETKIPNAVPKVEPLSRIGNQASYVVFGQRYYVMRSSKHYEEQGIASWYGTQFHTHHTSNGERYNMLAMTAAHKTLPLPTYIEVTNLINHRQIIVKVNDRGPFEANRLIDLSYVAAKKLGMLGHGTAKVNIKAIDPVEYYKHATHQASNRHERYHRPLPLPHHEKSYAPAASVYFQVGAFHNKSHAEHLKKRLVAMFSVPVQINLSHSLYHVKIGPIKSNTAAAQINKKLKTIGLNGKRETQTIIAANASLYEKADADEEVVNVAKSKKSADADSFDIT